MSSSSRYVLFPIRNEACWSMYKKALSAFWVVEEVDLSLDRFDELTQGEQHFLMTILSFFASSDLLVNENLLRRFLEDAPDVESSMFYTVQQMIEGVHSEMYSLLIDSYLQTQSEKDQLFRAFEKNPSVKRKADFIQGWMNSTRSYAHRLVAFCCVEGILFSSSFAGIYWFKKRGLMPGLSFSNELIARDESLHTDFGCLLYNQMGRDSRLSEKEAHAIVRDAVDVETFFVRDALKTRLIGMNSELMCEYVQFVANRLLVALGHAKLYPVENCPLEYMDLISVDGKTNFFERRVSEYAKCGVDPNNMGGANSESFRFTLDEEF